MENFLTIPLQEEIIKKGNVVLRGARGSGKTLMAMRWAIKKMQRGLDVAFICGCSTRYQRLKPIFMEELARQGIEVTWDMFNITRITGEGGIFFTSPYAHGTVPNRSLEQRTIVIDNADHLTRGSFARFNISVMSSFFITGTRDANTMRHFLAPSWSPIYCEFNQHHMVEAGLIQRMTPDEWASWYISPERVKEDFGPWRAVENRHNKYVLDKYDS